MDNKFSIGIAILLVIVVALGIWLMSDSSDIEEAQDLQSGELGLGGEIFNQLENATASLADKIPGTDIFEEKVNPIKDVYKNPFED